MTMKMIVLLLLISQHASGVEVYEGAESVLLPCQVPADVSRRSTAAVWNRVGLSNPTVLLRRQKSDNLDERDDLSGQNDFYKARTSMRVDALQTGVLSLTLRNPTVSDSGNYTCITRRAGEDQSKTEVQLKVTEPPPPVWPTVLSAVLVTPIILAAAFGLFLCCAYKRMKDREALQPKVVEVTQEEESLLLPFKTTADLSQYVTVEWTHNNMKIHVYESGNNQPHKQHQLYRGRTEMKEDALRTGDLSLTLKHLRLTDSGVYTCTVYNKDGHMLLQKSVILSVTVPQPKMVEVIGARTVHLPFKPKADLPQNVTVEWTDSNNMKVHVYESGNSQPVKQDQDYSGRTEMKEDALRTGDLSLTLKHLCLTDRGVYTSTVYNKDGHMLLQRVVTLRVRALEPDVLEVAKGKSVLLPFKTTAVLAQDVTVEWTGSNNKKVHVYESGNSQPVKQDQDYSGRTEMNEDPLRTKDLSLTLKYSRFTDSGVYTCTVYNKDGHMLLQKSVILSVTVLQVEMVEVTQGENHVLLPFKTTADLPQNVTVEWRLSKPIRKKVHVYESGNNQPVKQHQGYRGRTEMKEDALRTGDLSLTLKDPHPTDSGVYTCTIYNKDGEYKQQKSVTLSVRALQSEMVEVTQEESVVLSFKTTAVLAQNVTVEWTDSNNMKVHVYESGNNQPHKQHRDYRGRTEMKEDALRTGDLSLTLKHLCLTDSGVYTCTVYNKDGNKPLQKSVILVVTALQSEMVEVTQEESVVLGFETTAVLPQYVTVQWTDSNNKKVHVYESGNSQPVKQHRDYRGRTEMKEDALRTGDLSLTLKHLRLTDSGVYTCTVYNKDGEYEEQKSVILSVTDQPKPLVVTQGQKFVQLPFKPKADLPLDIRVEWTHNNVTVYTNVVPQHQNYSGRTEMDGDPQVNKDLSLTLKDLHLTDSGVYTCTVYKDGHMLIQKSVILGVKDLQPEVVEVSQGEESVHLSFETTADLPQAVTVQWTGSNNKKVHVYESGNNQPHKQDQGYRGRTEMKEDALRTGDLSLTLKHLRLTDSGVYTCTVYEKDGHMLLQKVVTLSVRATLKGTMADMLPCLRRRKAPKPEVKVEPRDTDYEEFPLMDVHST